MLNRVEAESDQQVTQIPTAEELAGAELRRLRQLRRWSQDEVARRMSASGHANWHQTTVGKTEAAARPLRLNEAVTLAALFDIPVTQLVAPITLNAADIEGEIRAEGERWEKVVAENQAAQTALEEAAVRTRAAQGDLARTAAEAGRVRARLDYLLGVRAILEGKSLDPELAAKITVQYSREQEQGR